MGTIDTMSGIGLYNETSLHNAIKEIYAKGMYPTEVECDGYVIDVIVENELIEIQTRSYSSIKTKLATLLKNHKIRLVYPLIVEKHIRVLDKMGKKILHERRSPKRGRRLDVLNELIYIPHLLSHKNFTLDVLSVNVLETRCDDGKGSWRRKGVRIAGRELTNIIKTETFTDLESFRSLLPLNLSNEFSSRSLKEDHGVSPRIVNKMLYVLDRSGAIQKIRKDGNLHIYTTINS